MTRVLVTGSNGFVGRHVCAMLEAQNCEVIGWDIGAETMWKDRRLPQVDAAVLLAAVGGVSLTRSNPDFVLENNFRAAMRWRHLECPVVLMSSASVYGNLRDEEFPFTVNTPTVPADAYGASKLMQELVFAGKPNVWTLRPSSMYGPGLDIEKPQTIAAHMIRWCMRNEPVPFIFDEDGKQTRDFLFVGDTVEIVRNILFRQMLGPRVICISSGIETPLIDALKTFSDAAGIEASWTCNGERKSPMRRCVGDPTEAELILGRKMTSLVDGAAATFAGSCAARRAAG